LSLINRALAAVDILKITRHASSNDQFDWGTYLPHLAQNFRVKKFEYKKIFDEVLNHKHVKNEINRVARITVRESDVSLEEEDVLYDKIVGQLTRRAYQLLMDMRCTLSDKLLRLTSYVLYKLLPCFLSGVVAHQAQIEMIKEAQQKMPNTPLVFLPLHRSHLDYILVTFILLNHDIRPPQVAAGDNLNIPVFG
jgi:glycerol-3-phosphate O-acyltransferase 1/2